MFVEEAGMDVISDVECGMWKSVSTKHTMMLILVVAKTGDL
jgi:hypothetical protein